MNRLEMATPGYPPPGMDEPRAQAARARGLGFRPVQAGVCLKKIADPGHRHSGGGVSTHGCPFQLSLEHARTWRNAAGEVFGTAEPHRVDLAGLAGLLAASRDLGLVVTLDGRSMYSPGHTFTILITQAGSQVTLDGLAPSPLIA